MLPRRLSSGVVRILRRGGGLGRVHIPDLLKWIARPCPISHGYTPVLCALAGLLTQRPHRPQELRPQWTKTSRTSSIFVNSGALRNLLFGALNPCPNPRPCLPISASLLCIASAFAPRHLSLTCTHGCCGGGGVCPGRRTTSFWCQRCCCRAARVATVGGGVPRAPRADPHRVGLGAHSSVCVLPPRVPRRSTGEPTPTRTRAPPASPTT